MLREYCRINIALKCPCAEASHVTFSAAATPRLQLFMLFDITHCIDGAYWLLEALYVVVNY
jgi:hypothetical protein